MKINILCDNKDSWFWNTSEIFLKNLEIMGHSVNVCQSESELKEADISAFISCVKIVSKTGLKKSTSNIVCHPSNLPKGRGFSPIAWEILNNMNYLTFTLFEADEEVDNGQIYKKLKVELKGTELNEEIKNIQAETTYTMILDYISQYPKNKSSRQVGEPTYYKKRTQLDSELDINKTIHEQFNLLRVVDNDLYPAFFYFGETKFILKIYKEKN